MDVSSYEVVVTADATNTAWNCCIWDAVTGATVTTFKKGNSVPRTVNLIGNDYLICALHDVPKIKVWSLGKTSRIECEYVCPAVVTALAVSPTGTYCLAGIKKKIYIWEVRTGNLLCVIMKHTGDINCIKFTDDGSYFVTGGQGSIVCVWKLNMILSTFVLGSASSTLHKPVFVWSDHSGPVSDVYVSGGGRNCRVATVSMDKFCHVYNLMTGLRISSVDCFTSLCSVVMDPVESFMYIGTDTGDILQVDMQAMFQLKYMKCYKDGLNTFQGHNGEVTSLSSSMDGRRLLSGSKDGTAQVWDILKKVNIHTFKHPGAVTNAFFALKPFVLTESDVMVQPIIKIQRFSLEVYNPQKDESFEINCFNKLKSAKLSTFNMEPCDEDFNKAIAKGKRDVGAQNRILLQQEVSELQTINEQLYAYSLSSFLSDVDANVKDQFSSHISTD